MGKLDQLREMREAGFGTLPGKNPVGKDVLKRGQGDDRLPALASPLTSSKRSKGRPLDKDRDKTLEATKPWKTAGMSRATWYRRRKKGKS